MLEAAQSMLSTGLCVLPARRDQKRPALAGWKKFQSQLPTAQQIDQWFAEEADAICLVTGKVSQNLELIDFDFCGELFEAWAASISQELLDRLFIERSQSGGRHVVYRCETEICGNLKLAQDRRDGKLVTLIETRGEGGLFLCHPTDGYTIEQGSLTSLPVLTSDERDQLLESAWRLNRIQESGRSAQPANPHRMNPAQPPTAITLHDRAIAYLAAMPPAIAGAGGHSQTYAAATALVHGFGLEPATALQVLSDHYNPRCDPPWSDKELHHKINQAATKPHQRPFGWLRDDTPIDQTNDVDLSGFMVGKSKALSPRAPTLNDPGIIPEHLFDVPGFVRQVMDFTLANAPYPNIGLAFCGAIALQSFLAGRKVCTSGDLRTNIYLLALASSGTGKEFPRKVNSHILNRVGMSASLGDKFASGEGIQDALIRTGAMLFQNDEMDGVLRQINSDQDNRRESIPNILLTLYTSASDIYPTRVKANQKEPILVDQPHLTLFGTATPQYFYESLSRRMLTNGFFARLNIVDVGRRGSGQNPGTARHPPDSVLEVAKWWAEFNPVGKPSKGNLISFHPDPLVVPLDEAARSAIEDLRLKTEAEYDTAQDQQDEVARTVWSRTCEQAKKLALIYACSENHEQPVIRLPAVKWATQFAMHQARRQLFLAAIHVAENPFHAACLKLLKKLRESETQCLPRRELMRTMRCKAADFDQIIGTLIQQGDIFATEIPSATKSAMGYQIAVE